MSMFVYKMFKFFIYSFYIYSIYIIIYVIFFIYIIYIYFIYIVIYIMHLNAIWLCNDLNRLQLIFFVFIDGMLCIVLDFTISAESFFLFIFVFCLFFLVVWVFRFLDNFASKDTDIFSIF